MVVDENQGKILSFEGKAYVKDNNGEMIFVEGAFENFFVYKVDLENKVLTVYVKTLEGTIVKDNKNYKVFRETWDLNPLHTQSATAYKYV